MTLRRVNAFAAGLTGAAAAPLTGLAYVCAAGGWAWNSALDTRGAAVMLLVLAVSGFAVGVLLCSLWNAFAAGA